VAPDRPLARRLHDDDAARREASQSRRGERGLGRAFRLRADAAGRDADFFTQARGLLLEGVESGDIGEADASRLQLLFDRIAANSSKKTTRAWGTAELRKSFPADVLAPRHARSAMAAVGVGLPEADLEIAGVLISELVTNSVIHGSTGEGSTVGVELDLPLPGD
jgi:hypothetical protein